MNSGRETKKMGVPPGNRPAVPRDWLRGVPERYVAGADTRGRPEARPYLWSQQVIHDISGLQVLLYQVEEIWSRRWDSNPRPADYESAALPLSYTGVRPALYHRTWRLSIIYIRPGLREKTGNAVGDGLEFEGLLNHRVEASAFQFRVRHHH